MKSIYVLIGTALLLSALHAQPENDWSVLMNHPDAVIYERSGEKGMEYKMVAQLNAPATTVIAFLSDFGNYQQFLEYFEKTETLERISPHEIYGYGLMASGGTTARADVVLHMQFKDLPGGSWIGRASAAPDYRPLVPGIRRDSTLEAMWAIQNLGAEGCRYTYHYFISREGLNPQYISQLAQSNYANVQRLRTVLENRPK